MQEESSLVQQSVSYVPVGKLIDLSVLEETDVLQNEMSNVAPSIERVHPDLCAIDFSAPQNKVNMEIIDENVVKMSNSNIVIASLTTIDAPLINFNDDICVLTQEASFSVFQGDQNFSNDIVIPLQSVDQSEETREESSNFHEILEPLVDLSFDDTSVSERIPKVENITRSIHPDLIGIDFQNRHQLNQSITLNEVTRSVFADLEIPVFDDMTIAEKKNRNVHQSICFPDKVNDFREKWQIVVISAVSILILLIIHVKLNYLPVVVLLISLYLYFRTKISVDLSNSDLNFYIWLYEKGYYIRHRRVSVPPYRMARLLNLCATLCMRPHFAVMHCALPSRKASRS